MASSTLAEGRHCQCAGAAVVGSSTLLWARGDWHFGAVDGDTLDPAPSSRPWPSSPVRAASSSPRTVHDATDCTCHATGCCSSAGVFGRAVGVSDNFIAAHPSQLSAARARWRRCVLFTAVFGFVVAAAQWRQVCRFVGRRMGVSC